MTDQVETTEVERSQMMGPWLTTALVVGTMVGSGIFMLPVSLAPLGPNALVGWVVSIAGALSIALPLRFCRGPAAEAGSSPTSSRRSAR